MGLTVVRSGETVVEMISTRAFRQEDDAVKRQLRYVYTSLAVMVLGSMPVQGQELSLSEPARFPAPNNAIHDNQLIANAVAAKLQQFGGLKGFRINIAVNNGVVQLNGRVSQPEHLERIAALAAEVSGVKLVENHVAVGASGTVTQTQALLQPGLIPGPEPKADPGLPFGGEQPQMPPMGQGQEPTPIFQAMPPSANPQSYNPPRMPPYAWPTYAPYNNFSRVAYPNLYPHNAWPFIGPMHPFPKVPLGWRSINLTWQDGYWWYGRNATGHDWWRVRYW